MGVFAVATDNAGNVYVADSSNTIIRKFTPAGVMTTLAGTAWALGHADGVGAGASFGIPNGIATDGAGNVYATDALNNTIRKITPAGVVTTLAGTAGRGGHADGGGSAASFNEPSGVATDRSGNVYVADTDNHTIRKITPTGVVTTLAGSAGVTGHADGAGSAASFNRPSGVATDRSGNVYVADTDNHTIRKITPTGVVTTLAGSAGVTGHADGAGAAASFSHPSGVAADSVGNVYVADTANQVIRRITPAGVAMTLAGNVGVLGHADGTGAAASFNMPRSVATDSAGNVYVADVCNGILRKMTPTGEVKTLAGTVREVCGNEGLSYNTSEAGEVTSKGAPSFGVIFGVATDNAGNVYVADPDNFLIRKISRAGVLTTLAGTAGVRSHADGTGIWAKFSRPTGVATDSAGNVYVADGINIRKITPAGVVTTLAGAASKAGHADDTGAAASFIGLEGVATDSAGNIYATDTLNNTIYKISPAGVVSTLAGTAGTSGMDDGTGAAARFNGPMGVATDSTGNIYVADSGNGSIRKITQAGVVTTLAHDSNWGYGLYGVATDKAGNIYATEIKSSTIYKITLAGVVTTFAGGGSGAAAGILLPRGLATDSAGNLYVADSCNFAVRKITPVGVVTTLAGGGALSCDSETGPGQTEEP